MQSTRQEIIEILKEEKQATVEDLARLSRLCDAMSEVHTIEIANGSHATAVHGPEIMESANDSHGDLGPSDVYNSRGNH